MIYGAFLFLCCFCVTSLRANSPGSLQVLVTSQLENSKIVFSNNDLDPVCELENIQNPQSLRLGYVGTSVLDIFTPTAPSKAQPLLKTANITSKGNLIVKGLGKNLVLNGHPFWTLIAHEDFETPLPQLTEEMKEDIFNWNDTRTDHCGNIHDTFLGGYCNFAGDLVSKAYMLPQHSYVHLTARYHFIDRWLGESAYMLVDGVTVWTKSHMHCKKVYLEYCRGLNICGDEKYSDTLSHLVDITIPHNNSIVEVAFGSSLEEDPCVASWGVDDIVISVL